MITNLSDEQLYQLITNAINASKPVGMGFLHYKDGDYTVQDIKNRSNIEEDLHIDYFEGRMVKLTIVHEEDGTHIIPDNPNPEYQSWAWLYPTMEDLIASVETNDAA